jgi:hypothetical protein
MSALGINATDREVPSAWGNLRTTHPETRLHALSLSAWKLASLLADEPEPDWAKINMLQEAAQLYEEMDRHEDEQYAKAVMTEEGLP